MKRKSILLTAISIVVVSVSLLLIGCEKQDVAEVREDTQEYVKGITYQGVELKTDDVYGSYLSFKDQESFDTIFNYLENQIYNEEGLRDWEDGLNFFSLRAYQEEEQMVPDDIYPSVVMSTLLNKSGYVEVGSVVYEDKHNGEEVYTITNDGKSLYFSDKLLKSLKTSNSCYRGDDVDVKTGQRTASGVYTLRVQGKIDHWKNYISGSERLYVKTWIYAADPKHGSWYSVKGDLEVSANFEVVVDGRTRKISIEETSDNDSYLSLRIASGDDICINYGSATHTGSWGTGTLSAYTSVYDESY